MRTIDNSNVTVNYVDSNVFTCSVNVIACLCNDFDCIVSSNCIFSCSEYKVCKNTVSSYVCNFVSVLEVNDDLTVNVCVNDKVLSSEYIAVFNVLKSKSGCIISNDVLGDEETAVVSDFNSYCCIFTCKNCCGTNRYNCNLKSGNDYILKVGKLSKSCVCPYLFTVRAVPVLNVTVLTGSGSNCIEVLEVIRTCSGKNYVLDVCKLCKSLVSPYLLTLVAYPVLNVTVVVASGLNCVHMNEEVGTCCRNDYVLAVCDLSCLSISKYCVTARTVPVLSVTNVVAACLNSCCVLELMLVCGRFGFNHCITCECDGTVVKCVGEVLSYCSSESRICEIADYVSVLEACCNADVPAVANLSVCGKLKCDRCVVAVLSDAISICGSLEVEACHSEVFILPIKALLFECERSSCYHEVKLFVGVSDESMEVKVKSTESEATVGNDLTLLDIRNNELCRIVKEESCTPEAVGVNILAVTGNVHLYSCSSVVSGNCNVFCMECKAIESFFLNGNDLDVTVVVSCRYSCGLYVGMLILGS